MNRKCLCLCKLIVWIKRNVWINHGANYAESTLFLFLNGFCDQQLVLVRLLSSSPKYKAYRTTVFFFHDFFALIKTTETITNITKILCFPGGVTSILNMYHGLLLTRKIKWINLLSWINFTCMECLQNVLIATRISQVNSIFVQFNTCCILGHDFLFVGLRHTFRNFKVRRSKKKIK